MATYVTSNCFEDLELYLKYELGINIDLFPIGFEVFRKLNKLSENLEFKKKIKFLLKIMINYFF